VNKGLVVASRHRRTLVGGMLVGTLIGAVWMVAMPAFAGSSYKVSEVIVANSLGQNRNVAQDALRVTRASVAGKAAETLGETDTARSLWNVFAVADEKAQTVEITAVAHTSADASRVAEAFASAFVSEMNAELGEARDRDLASLQARVDAANAALKSFEVANPTELAPGGIGSDEAIALRRKQRDGLREEVERAVDSLQAEQLKLEDTPAFSRLGADEPKRAGLLRMPSDPWLLVALSLCGLAIAGGIVRARETKRPVIDTAKELRKAFEFPVLAEVGALEEEVTDGSTGAVNLDAQWAEPYRRIRSSVQLAASALPSGRSGIFLFTSPAMGEGKSLTTALTALALAEKRVRTLVIGGDFRRPAIETLLGVPGRPGIRDVLSDAAAGPIETAVHPTAWPELFAAAAGLGSPDVIGMADVACQLAGRAVSGGATVLIDSCPMSVANDTIDLLPVVDHVILVVRSGHTTRDSIEEAVVTLGHYGASILGAVIVGVPGLRNRLQQNAEYHDRSAVG
jgi:Mrp family chromosome partitioning ATPase